MKPPRILAACVLSLAAFLPELQAGELAIEGLRHVYANTQEVRVVIRNTGQVPIYLDSFQPDILVVDHLARDGVTWVRGSGWHCANAGVGTPTPISPGRTLEVPLVKSWAFKPQKDPQYFEAESGEQMLLHGWYRISVRYSLEEWSNIVHIPHLIKTEVSAAFEVK